MEKEKSYQLLKRFENGDEIYQEEATESEVRQTLINIYDVINQIADNLLKRGINVKSWFIKPSQLNLMKKSPKYRFL